MTAPEVTIMSAWPRAMTKDLACSYCGKCRPDELPPPSYRRGRSAIWLIEDLNAHLDALAGRRTIDDEMMEAMG